MRTFNVIESNLLPHDHLLDDEYEVVRIIDLIELLDSEATLAIAEQAIYTERHRPAPDFEMVDRKLIPPGYYNKHAKAILNSVKDLITDG